MTALKARPMPDTIPTDSIPTEAELIARALALVPVLRARAEAAEANRSLLDETLQDFVKAGFYRICQPKEFGGYEHSPEVLFRVSSIIARGCPSSAWCLCLIGVHNWEVGLLDPRVGQDLWDQDDTVRYSSSYAPFGKVVEVEGGYRISGQWPWSSGCDHCSWVMLGAVVMKEGAPPDMRSFLIPRSEYEIIDTWHVLGLKGTGSKDVLVKDAFVPAYRTHSFMDSFLRKNPGQEHYKGSTYLYPFGTTFAFCLASVALGIAEGALEVSIEYFRERRDVNDGSSSLNDPFFRQRLAEADAMVRGLNYRRDAAYARMDKYVSAGQHVPVEEGAASKWDAQCIGKEAVEAVDLLFKISGGRGAMLSHPIQRYFRDVHTASNHAFLNADKGSVNMGGLLMGAEPKDIAV
jgi:3-hydroxy-9,10-secoandrosta-1,3,5(10)-triene-9,17-dione monooxygenase